MVHRIDSPGSVGGAWVGGNPFDGIEGTVAAPDWLNAFQEELVSLVEAEGLTPTKANTTQVREAILRLVARVSGGELSFTTGVALTAGEGLLSGDVFGVVKESVGIAATATLQVAGTFVLPKVPADAIALHARLYWNAGLGQVTTTAGANRTIGVATAAAPAATTSVSVLLSGPPNL